MDENLKIIYEILKKLESGMDIPKFDKSVLSYSSLEISKPKWCRIMKMLYDSGYITGINVWMSYDCTYPQVELTRPEITLKGLEYLQENSIMQRLLKTAKGIKEITPGF